MRHAKHLMTPRCATTLLLAISLCFVSMGFACDQKPTTKAQGIAFAKDIASGLRSAAPLITQLKPAAGAIINRAIPIADRVIAAVEASDAVTTAALLNDLLPLVNDIVGQFTGNTKVLAFVALADIGIHFLINHAPEIFGGAALQAAASQSAEVDPLEKYAAQPIWGCAYHPKRCKN